MSNVQDDLRRAEQFLRGMGVTSIEFGTSMVAITSELGSGSSTTLVGAVKNITRRKTEELKTQVVAGKALLDRLEDLLLELSPPKGDKA